MATYIETGFNEFLLNAKVNIGDKLCFSITISPDFIDVTIVRRDKLCFSQAPLFCE
jgi:hypothetical protein